MILDSSVVIAAERAGQTAYQMVQTMGSDDTELALSVVTILELAHGVARANTEARHTIRQRFLQDLHREMDKFYKGNLTFISRQ